MKTKILFSIALVICLINPILSHQGGDGGGGGGPKIIKGVFSKAIGDGDGGGGPKPTKNTYLVTFGGEAGGGGGSTSGGGGKLTSVLIKSTDSNYILESMSTEEVEYFLENYLTNEDVIDVRRF